jgi:hypothetical protein
VELLLELSTPSVREEYQEKERHARQLLLGLGINPDLPLVLIDDVEEEEQRVPTKDKVLEKAINMGVSETSDGNGNKGLKHVYFLDYQRQDTIHCDYCGGAGHLAVDCPHDNRIASDDDDGDDELEVSDNDNATVNED